MRLLGWSGPRNLSTALMYAFAARDDCVVVDEPFYAAWLAATGTAHPMRAEILAAQSTDPDAVAGACAQAPASGHVYQKHMVHHMAPGFDRSFMAGAVNLFLIRHPARVVASYHAKREHPTPADIGATEILALWEEARALGPAPVVAAEDIRADPAATLQRLCSAIGLPWQPQMTRWPAGGHPADGVWARHWYGSVHRSTGFAGAEGPLPDLPPGLAAVADAARPAYQVLHRHRV